ncbi:MAG: hypothetical protein ACFFAO_20085 [Candidatus Hermodarchaeota archaeon]
MAEINIKSLVLGFIMGFLNWLWAFIIVGSAYYDFATNTPRPFVFEFYIALLIVNAAISLAIFTIYLWKYEQNNPIIPDKWAIDAVILGAIICAMNFLFDILFFGVFLQLDLLAYFFLESTAGYFYPTIILWMLVLAYLIYGRK